jgi:hypothetical protein
MNCIQLICKFVMFLQHFGLGDVQWDEGTVTLTGGALVEFIGFSDAFLGYDFPL